MEKLDLLKKHQEKKEEDSVIFYQKETQELVDLLQKGNTNISRKLTRIPFYRLEKLKKIEEEKLKNIHKAEKKKEKDLAKVGKGHDYHQVERRRYKRTKKQKEIIQQNINKEAQIKEKEKEINIINKENKINIKESNKSKNNINKIEENEFDKDKKKAKLNTISINSTENKSANKINFQNNINLTERNNTNNKYNILSRNYSDYFHNLKYAPSSIKFSKKELRMSKKQQKIQNPEYTLGHFLSKEDKEKFNSITHKANKDKKLVIQKKPEKIKLSNATSKPLIKKVNSEKKIINITNKNIKEKEHKINKIPSSDNIKNKTFNENLIEDEKNIIKEDIVNENEKEDENIKETFEKKRGQLKLLRKKHKRMNKYKKAILKFRLAKKRAFCEAVQKDNEQLFFSNTFNADESINNVINNVLNQNINADENVNNNNNTYNEQSYNMSMISENKIQDNIQDKSQINTEINLSNKFSPILPHRKIEINNNNINNSFLNYYSNNHESNITMNSFNKEDTSSKYNNSENINNINNANLSNTYFAPNFQNNNNFNNNYLQNNNSYIYSYPNSYNNQNIYINNNIYNYCYNVPPYAPFQYNTNNYYNNYNYNYGNNISNINDNSYNNNYDNSNKINFSMNNTLPLPKTIYPEFPPAKVKLKKEKKKEKKISNYIENLKTENNRLSSLNLDTMNGKELTSLIKENKDIDKIDLNLINILLPEEQANSFDKKYTGISKAENSQNNSENTNNKKPIREYVDQILDKNFEKIFSDFIIKLRDVYYKKKSIAPLKAKKRIVLGMREIEKNIKLKNIFLVFVVPYIEKVDGIKNSMDQRILDIFENCRKNEIPVFFGLNKFKLGQIARKKISAISMLGIVNVEGMENELKNIIKIGNELKKKWYLDNYEKKEIFKDNKFINQDNFEYFHNMNLTEEINTNNEKQNESK